MSARCIDAHRKTANGARGKKGNLYLLTGVTTTGRFVENLSRCQVERFKDIEIKMRQQPGVAAAFVEGLDASAYGVARSLGRGICCSWRCYQHRLHTPVWAFAFDDQTEGAGREIRQHLLRTADMVDLRSVPADTVWATQLINGADPTQVLVECDPEEVDVCIALNKPWDQCLEQISPKLRRRTQQSLRRLERQGTLALSVLTDPGGLEEALTECLELENAGWKGRNGTAICCSPATECFYKRPGESCGRSRTAGYLHAAFGWKVDCFWIYGAGQVRSPRVHACAAAHARNSSVVDASNRRSSQ